MTSSGTKVWNPESWRNLRAEQQPVWPDSTILEESLGVISTLPPLVFAGEAGALKRGLAKVADGRALLLQAGDCSESFRDFSADGIRDTLRIILQMAVVLTYAAGTPVIKVGRLAGQFAKPRSSPYDIVQGKRIPAFRGHMVNDDAPTIEARRPDPHRLVSAYHQSASTLNLLRAFTRGGFADLSQVHMWNQEFISSSRAGARYEAIASEIDRALRFMSACGINVQTETAFHEVEFYTSHEALILAYEQALTRRDSLTGDWYDTSAHLLWCGERTRQLEGAHLHFLSGIHNPVAVKLGPAATPQEVVAMCRLLDRDREPGRLTLVSRMGAKRIAQVLPPIQEAVRTAGHPVVWVCDPMHGNTVMAKSGHKTRHFDAMMAEVSGFFSACTASGVWPGGIHVELTGDSVTECLGGADEIGDGDLSLRYTTTCDPRLNGRQALELSFRVAELLWPLQGHTTTIWSRRASP